MKKNIFALFFLGLTGVSSISYAASPNAQLDNTLYNKPRYSFSIGLTFLQPSSTNLDYAVLGFPFPTQSPHWDVQLVNPGYSTGFDMMGRYFLPDNQNDLRMDWTHLNTSNSSATQVETGNFVVFVFQAGPSAGQDLNNPSQQANATAKFVYDVVNLDVGHFFDFDTIQLRLFLGLSAAQLKQNLDVTFRDNAATFSINSVNNSRFDGIGPLIGVDGLYKLPYNFELFTSISASGLIGNLNTTTKYHSTSPELTASGIDINYQSITPDDSIQVVPGLNGKLGFNYSQSLSNWTIVTAALGYEYATYFNALVFYNPSVVFGNVNTGTIALSSLGKSASNLSVNGPFLNVDFKF